jgi:hypothetical protein
MVGFSSKKAKLKAIPIVEFIISHSNPIARELVIFVRNFLTSGSIPLIS